MFFHSKYWLLSLIIILSCEGPLFEIPAEPDTTPPIVVITNPADRAILSDSVLVTIFATDNDEVELVQLFINDSLVLDSAKAPYEYKWSTADYEEDEFHNLRARAVDYANNDNQTSPVRVTVDNIDNIKPTGSLLYPFSGQILNGSVSIIAEADDNDSLKSVVYYINGDSVGVKTSPPFIYEWDTTLEYDDYYYVINVQINDVTGNHITLGPISVYIDNEENIQEDTTPPTGAIIYPPAAAIVSGIVNIQIDAFDNEKVEEVEIVIDGNFSYTDQSSPYEYSWDTRDISLEDADHFITATVTDSSGNTTNLMPVTVHVDNEINIIVDETPPSVVITNPAANQTVSGIVTISTSAFDNIAIEKVEFYQNATLIESDISFPYEITWNTLPEDEDSEHIWSAKAYDTSDLTGQSQSIAVYVNNEDNIPPTGFIAQPYGGQFVNGDVEILISASDNIGVTSVNIYINGESEVTLTDYPYSYIWNTIPMDEDEQAFITAKINDAHGNFFNVQQIAVTVNNNVQPNDDIPPVISILSPVSNTIVNDSTQITIYAQDNIGVDYVLLSIDDSLEITLSDSPYVYNWNTFQYPNDSYHLISAIAFDSSNNQTVAQSISVTVDNNYSQTISDLFVEQGVGEINLSWDIPYDAEQFKIHRQDIGFIGLTTETTYTDTTITPGTVYCYQISAINSQNIEGPLSEDECNKALIPAPLNFNGVVMQDTVSLTWSSVNEAGQYRIYRDGGILYTGTELDYIDSDLDYNSVYSFTISCLDDSGDEGPESDPIIITTHQELFAPELSVGLDSLDFQLNWSSVQTATAYKIYVNDVFEIELENLTHTFTGTSSTEYCFKVKPLNIHGTVGPESNQVCETAN